MPTRDHAPDGSPCWADLWTSDVEGSSRFYGELFGWEAQEPSAEFGGYFMFTRGGVPVAGGMGDMGDLPADNSWKIYLSTDDVARTVRAAEAGGAQIVVPAMPVADLGIQTVMVDPGGAVLGAWQPGTFPGFTVLGEHGAPSWFELHTRDYAGAARLLPVGVRLGDRHGRRPRRVPLRHHARPAGRGGAGRGHGRHRRSCPTGSRPAGPSTGRSTTPMPPWPRWRRSADRS